MKRLALFCGVLLLFAGVASAQDAPKAEVFGGYSFLHVSNDGGSANFNGGTGSLAYNLTPWLGVVGDVGGYHWSHSSTDELRMRSHIFSAPRSPIGAAQLRPSCKSSSAEHTSQVPKLIAARLVFIMRARRAAAASTFPKTPSP